MIVPPALFGHEMAGVISEVSPELNDWKIGDRVVVANSAPCGDCFYCLSGRPALCELGAGIRWSGHLQDGTSRFRQGDREIRHFAGVSSFGELTETVDVLVPAVRQRRHAGFVKLYRTTRMPGRIW